MSNENLKDALRDAGLTAERFAEIIDVDPKTVQRWIAGRTPYPRHRATVARALELTEHQLWPDAVPEARTNLASSDGQGSLGDVVGSWGQASDPGVPHMVGLISRATQRIDVRHDGRRFVLSDGLVAAIVDRARAGCEIAVVTQWPTPELASLIGVAGVEVRVSNAYTDATMLRADDEMLLLFALVGERGQHPATLYLRRNSEGGLFDRVLAHAETERRNFTAELLTDPEQIDAYTVSWTAWKRNPKGAPPTGFEVRDQPPEPLGPTDQTPPPPATRQWPRSQP